MKDGKEVLHETTPDTQDPPEEEARKRSEDGETALNFFKSQLWEAKGRRALYYLISKRGYTEEEIKAMELGFVPFKKVLKKNLGDLFKSLGLNVKGFGETHTIVIPCRDPEGRIKGFVVRRLDNERPKYIYSKGTEFDTLFNLNRARGEKHCIVVEGYFDALIATQRGIQGVVAIGGSRLTEKRLEDSIRYGVTTITLIPDNDERGLKGAERSLELIREKGLSAFVLELPDGFKDLDEFMRGQGIEAFEKLRKQAKSGNTWKPKKLPSMHSNIKVSVRSADSTRITQIYYIKKDNVHRPKESHS